MVALVSALGAAFPCEHPHGQLVLASEREHTSGVGERAGGVLLANPVKPLSPVLGVWQGDSREVQPRESGLGGIHWYFLASHCVTGLARAVRRGSSFKLVEIIPYRLSHCRPDAGSLLGQVVGHCILPFGTHLRG